MNYSLPIECSGNQFQFNGHAGNNQKRTHLFVEIVLLSENKFS